MHFHCLHFFICHLLFFKVFLAENPWRGDALMLVLQGLPYLCSLRKGEGWERWEDNYFWMRYYIILYYITISFWFKQIAALADGRSWSEETSSAKNYEPPLSRNSSSSSVSRAANGSNSMSYGSSSPESMLGISKYERPIFVWLSHEI